MNVVSASLRQIAVDEGRAMLNVLHSASRRQATVGICPGCWNTRQRRALLIEKLEKMGYTVAHGSDMADGIYLEGERHAPGCPYGMRI